MTNEEVRRLESTRRRGLKDENAFSGLHIQNSDFLNDINGRSPCVRCGKSRKYFCYTCYIPLPIIADKIPTVKLPFQIDILKHPKEIDGKSTAVHAALMAPDHVNIYTYPNFPDYSTQHGITPHNMGLYSSFRTRRPYNPKTYTPISNPNTH
ncbi:hypothetical protein Pmani_037217 [Petrolisthes manimaculis]|uniref:tRNA-uridine aminocarboxypropyltransferase 1 n=1 Tax=Petrolisthes manimaculis TaxID=1843537 RepID=A0AAE1NIW6_9EUCA|nr:hypothetical protein Pmani_037217 [Petrolisthes manimaculis]